MGPMAESGGEAQARERADGTPRKRTHTLLSMVPAREIATAWAAGGAGGSWPGTLFARDAFQEPRWKQQMHPLGDLM